MTARYPEIVVWCANEDCEAYGIRDRVPAWVEHGHYECLIEADKACPLCGARRRIER